MRQRKDKWGEMKRKEESRLGRESNRGKQGKLQGAKEEKEEGRREEHVILFECTLSMKKDCCHKTDDKKREHTSRHI